MDSQDLNSMLGNLMSDPEILSKAMSLASKLRENGEVDPSSKGMQDGNAEKSKPLDIGSLMGLLGGASSLGGADASKSESKCRKDLLYALKPFLSVKRQEKLDFLMKILTLLESAELLTNLGSKEI